jgi:hypothetical protein
VTDTPPEPHQLEISVFGPGIGECVVVHIGNGDWIVVDSCIDRDSGLPIALIYLKSLRIDVASQVKLVVATHWHDDHIQGLAAVMREAQSAKFVNSAAFAFHDLVRIVKIGSRAVPLASATTEYADIIELLKVRRLDGEKKEAVGPVQALANRRLLISSSDGHAIDTEVFALSSADGVMNLARAELDNALAAMKQQRRPIRQGPNQLCVVLWLKVGDLNALLGADLEHVTGTTEGWRAILASNERPAGRAGFFKIPHHGSKNADCPECWADLLLEQPISVLTPYSPSRLPRPEDVTRLCAHTNQVFLTSDPRHYHAPRRANAVEKTLRETGAKPRALSGRMGHVRVRADARDPGLVPEIELRNGATQQYGAPFSSL